MKCPTHPRYQVLRKPTSKCKACWVLWKTKARPAKPPAVLKPASCEICKKTQDFCKCTDLEKADFLLKNHKRAIRGSVLFEVSDWLAGQARLAGQDGKHKRAARIAVMAEAVAQDRMLG